MLATAGAGAGDGSGAGSGLGAGAAVLSDKAWPAVAPLSPSGRTFAVQSSPATSESALARRASEPAGGGELVLRSTTGARPLLAQAAVSNAPATTGSSQ